MGGSSKKPASLGQTSLFAYFKPPQARTDNVEKPVVTESLAVREPMDIDRSKDASTNEDQTIRNKKRISYAESDSDDPANDESYADDPLVKSPSDPDRFNRAKRTRRARRIEESDEEYTAQQSDDDDENTARAMALVDDITREYMQNAKKDASVTPLQQRFEKISVKSPLRPSSSSTSNNFLSSITSKEEQRKDRSQKFKEKNEVRYAWLTHLKDAAGNPAGSPEYDPRTLYIPTSAWSSFTPFEKQFWEVKSKQWDTVVFFKKGKFYELYEKDADIGHRDFDLKLTDRVNMRMVGVPEMSFDYWAAQFIAKGHKVAKVDQLETAIGKTLRERNDVSKADKVIRRELTSVLTAGTLVDAGLLTDDMSTYCMAIKEHCPAATSDPEFGICFVDTSTAEFNLTTFTDDVNRTKFETLIMQLKPRELVVEKGRLSAPTLRILKNALESPIWNALTPDTEFWDARTTQDEIRTHSYFGEDTDMDSFDSWPDVFKTALQHPLMISSLGGLVSYLRILKLDKELLSAKNICMYDPIRSGTSLVLDGQTLANLEVFQNSHDGSTEGTVFKLLANSVTPFGKRLFKQWLCHPLRKASDINARLDAVEDLMRLDDVREKVTAHLTALPDLERLISRIHSKRCKVKEFLVTLDGFRKTNDLIRWLIPRRESFRSAALQKLIDTFPEVDEQLNYFQKAFITDDMEMDYQKVRTMIPVRGMNKEWDTLNEELRGMEDDLDQHLFKMAQYLDEPRLVFKNLGKEIFQIEVPKKIKVPRDWIQLSATSKVNRYWTPTIKTTVPKFKELMETRNAFLKNFTSQVYTEFDQHYTKWLQTVQTMAEMDALLGLAKGSANLGEPACRPELIEQETSVLEFEELRHPCVVPGVATDFIPNDTHLGGKEPSIIVLTGPNMGGKSTLLRQTCVAIIMAQLGCYVPAKSCRLTPCDRIFTRIGANDNIMAGQSTFMVELNETSKILHEATPRSMVILDELGRGTSTFDGYAIAYAVLHYLATHVGCLAMFSTHYQTLCREFERNPEINNMHMGYFLDQDTVTFLYKLTPGICEKSFGMNVAQMAGVPSEVIQKADKVAEQFEASHRLKDSTLSSKGASPAMLADLAYLMSPRRIVDQHQTRVLRRILQGMTTH